MAEPHANDTLDTARLAYDVPEVREVSPEEAWEIFDRDAQALMGISGEEFLRRYDAGEYDTMSDDSSRESQNLWSMVFSLPFIGRHVR